MTFKDLAEVMGLSISEKEEEERANKYQWDWTPEETIEEVYKNLCVAEFHKLQRINRG